MKALARWGRETERARAARRGRAKRRRDMTRGELSGDGGGRPGGGGLRHGELGFPEAKVASSILAGGATVSLEEQRKTTVFVGIGGRTAKRSSRTAGDAIGRHATRVVATGRQRATESTGHPFFAGGHLNRGGPPEQCESKRRPRSDCCEPQRRKAVPQVHHGSWASRQALRKSAP